MKKFKPIKVTLTFREQDIQGILDAANFGDGEPLEARKLTPAQYKELKDELVATAEHFVWEIVDGTNEACANGWLEGFSGEDSNEDE